MRVIGHTCDISPALHLTVINHPFLLYLPQAIIAEEAQTSVSSFPSQLLAVNQACLTLCFATRPRSPPEDGLSLSLRRDISEQSFAILDLIFE